MYNRTLTLFWFVTKLRNITNLKQNEFSLSFVWLAVLIINTQYSISTKALYEYVALNWLAISLGELSSLGSIETTGMLLSWEDIDTLADYLSTSTTDENIKAVKKMISDNSRIASLL